MMSNLVIAGIGGQGVVYAAKVLAHAALARGEKVMASENHGMSQRGGSVLAHLKIGDSLAPLIRRGTAHALIALDRSEAIRNLTFVRVGGCVIVNSRNGLDPAVTARLEELEIGVFTVDADARARDIGAPAAANLIVLGLAAAQGPIGLSLDGLKDAVHTLGPAKHVELNWRALEMGASAQPQTANPGFSSPSDEYAAL